MSECIDVHVGVIRIRALLSVTSVPPRNLLYILHLFVLLNASQISCEANSRRVRTTGGQPFNLLLVSKHRWVKDTPGLYNTLWPFYKISIKRLSVLLYLTADSIANYTKATSYID